MRVSGKYGAREQKHEGSQGGTIISIHGATNLLINASGGTAGAAKGGRGGGEGNAKG